MYGLYDLVDSVFSVVTSKLPQTLHPINISEPFVLCVLQHNVLKSVCLPVHEQVTGLAKVNTGYKRVLLGATDPWLVGLALVADRKVRPELSLGLDIASKTLSNSPVLLLLERWYISRENWKSSLLVLRHLIVVWDRLRSLQGYSTCYLVEKYVVQFLRLRENVWILVDILKPVLIWTSVFIHDGRSIRLLHKVDTLVGWVSVISDLVLQNLKLSKFRSLSSDNVVFWSCENCVVAQTYVCAVKLNFISWFLLWGGVDKAIVEPHVPSDS